MVMQFIKYDYQRILFRLDVIERQIITVEQQSTCPSRHGCDFLAPF